MFLICCCFGCCVRVESYGGVSIVALTLLTSLLRSLGCCVRDVSCEQTVGHPELTCSRSCLTFVVRWMLPWHNRDPMTQGLVNPRSKLPDGDLLPPGNVPARERSGSCVFADGYIAGWKTLRPSQPSQFCALQGLTRFQCRVRIMMIH